MNEIVKNEKVIFQNGNQGLYFMHVLCSSEVLIGENIYLELIKKLDLSRVEISIIEKIRYYIWMLRRNYIAKNDIYTYKKYLPRILKDILILEKVIDYSNISEFNNRQIINLYIENHKSDLSVTEIYLLVNIINLDKIKEIEIESTLTLISNLVNIITWKNL